MITRYFVSHDRDGSISHLARVFDDDTALWGEFYINGEWQAHESATDYLFERSSQEEIDEGQAQQIVESLAAASQQAPEAEARAGEATADQAAVIREGLAKFLPGGGPELPDPIPDHGYISDDDWSIRYALNTDESGNPRLDFLAENRFSDPLIGQVSHDGEAVVVESVRQSYSYDPEVEGDKDAAEQALFDHHRAVEQLLQARRLA